MSTQYECKSGTAVLILDGQEVGIAIENFTFDFLLAVHGVEHLNIGEAYGVYEDDEQAHEFFKPITDIVGVPCRVEALVPQWGVQIVENSENLGGSHVPFHTRVINGFVYLTRK